MRRKGMLKTDNFVIGIQYRWKMCPSEKKKQTKKERNWLKETFFHN